MIDKGSFNMKIWGKAFQTRKWWRTKKKKWVAKYSNWTLEKKIIRKHSLSIKISPKVHPALMKYLIDILQVQKTMMRDLLKVPLLKGQ